MMLSAVLLGSHHVRWEVWRRALQARLVNNVAAALHAAPGCCTAAVLSCVLDDGVSKDDMWLMLSSKTNDSSQMHVKHYDVSNFAVISAPA
jgi:hypothetical protein